MVQYLSYRRLPGMSVHLVKPVIAASIEMTRTAVSLLVLIDEVLSGFLEAPASASSPGRAVAGSAPGPRSLHPQACAKPRRWCRGCAPARARGVQSISRLS